MTALKRLVVASAVLGLALSGLAPVAFAQQAPAKAPAAGQQPKAPAEKKTVAPKQRTEMKTDRVGNDLNACQLKASDGERKACMTQVMRSAGG